MVSALFVLSVCALFAQSISAQCLPSPSSGCGYNSASSIGGCGYNTGFNSGYDYSSASNIGSYGYNAGSSITSNIGTYDFNNINCNCGLNYDNIVAPGTAVSSGGPLEVIITSALAPTGLYVNSNLDINGLLNAYGSLPVLAAVDLQSDLPTSGSAAVTYNCGNGQVGISAESLEAAGLSNSGYGFGIGPVATPYNGQVGIFAGSLAAGLGNSGYSFGYGSGCGASAGNGLGGYGCGCGVPPVPLPRPCEVIY